MRRTIGRQTAVNENATRRASFAQRQKELREKLNAELGEKVVGLTIASVTWERIDRSYWPTFHLTNGREIDFFVYRDGVGFGLANSGVQLMHRSNPHADGLLCGACGAVGMCLTWVPAAREHLPKVTCPVCLEKSQPEEKTP